MLSFVYFSNDRVSQATHDVQVVLEQTLCYFRVGFRNCPANSWHFYYKRYKRNGILGLSGNKTRQFSWQVSSSFGSNAEVKQQVPVFVVVTQVEESDTPSVKSGQPVTR
jgi:hypothetical protein